MSNYDARDIDRAVDATEITSEADRWGYTETSGGWDVFTDLSAGTTRPVEVGGESVAFEVMDAKFGDYNDDGYGASIWLVVKVGTQFFRKEGYYNSCDGHNWDGTCREVFPQDRVVRFYE